MEINNTELFLFIDGNWKALELSDNIPFHLTYNIADIRDITKRNTTFSKTLTIPGTKNNNDLFNYIFDIANVSTYNVNKKVRCSIVVGTIPVMSDAFIQLTDIKTDDNLHFIYECNIIGDTDSIVKDFGAKLMTDLDVAGLDHTYSEASIVNSWSGNYGTGYFYGLADFGYNWDITTIGPGSAIGANISNMIPQIYIRYLWNKIFSEAGWTYESSFIDGGAWDDILLLSGSTLIQSKLYSFINSFKVGLGVNKVLTLGHTNQQAYTYPGEVNNPLQFGYVGSDSNVINGYDPILSPVSVSAILEDLSTYTSFYPSRLQFTDETSGNYHDVSNLWDSTIWEYTVQTDPGYLALGTSINITIPSISTMFGVNSLGQQPPEFIFFDVLLFRSSMTSGSAYNACNLTNNGYYDSGFKVGFIYGTSSNAPATENGYTLLSTGNSYIKQFSTPLFNQPGSPSLTNPYAILQTGEKLWFKLIARASGRGSLYTGNDTIVIGPSFSVTIGTNETYAFNYVDSTLIPGQPLDANSALPKQFKQIDFFSGLVKMFNLYIEPHKTISKRLIIEPRDDYYSGGTLRNWTNKVDISQEVHQQVIAETQAKELYLTYKLDKDAYNVNYSNTFKEIYGEYKYTIDNDFVKGDAKVEVPFASTPVRDLMGSNELSFDSIILPVIAKDDGGIMSRTDFIPRILYKTSTGTASIDDPSNYFRMAGTLYPYYPYIGHFNDPREATSDLNFGETQKLYYNNNKITTNNLFTNYYEKQLDELTHRDSRIVTVNMILTPQDMNDFSFRDRIILDGISSGAINYFRINKIEYDPTSKGTFKVEFLKAKDIPKRSTLGTTSVGNGVSVDVGVGVMLGTNNTNYNPRSLVLGSNNLLLPESPRSLIIGESNTIGGVRSTIILGNNNRMLTSSSNSFLIGDNITQKSGQTGIISNTPVAVNINLIDGGQDIILSPFNNLTIINYIDGGQDVILPIGSRSVINVKDGSQDMI